MRQLSHVKAPLDLAVIEFRISVVQQSRNVHKDWPADPKLDLEVDDSWVDILRQRLKRPRSRLSEHDVRYLGLQIVQSPGL